MIVRRDEAQDPLVRTHLLGDEEMRRGGDQRRQGAEHGAGYAVPLLEGHDAGMAAGLTGKGPAVVSMMARSRSTTPSGAWGRRRK